MRIVVVAVGKVKERGVREAIDDYEARIARYTRFSEIEIVEAKERDVLARFEKVLSRDARTVALEVDGRRVSSPDLAALIGRHELTSPADLVFLIGGSYGLPRAISEAASARLSLSDLTLPHRLARLVLVEQLYRAFTILRNEPYSH